MAFFHKKSPWEIEWADLMKREAKFEAKRKEGPTSVLVQKLDRFVPDKLTGTLNAAFLKAFEIIFEKGTGVIEKTYRRHAGSLGIPRSFLSRSEFYRDTYLAGRQHRFHFDHRRTG